MLFIFQIRWKRRCHILVTFPSHLKKLHSILRSWLEKLNCGFFHSWKTPPNNFSSQNFSVDNNYSSILGNKKVQSRSLWNCFTELPLREEEKCHESNSKPNLYYYWKSEKRNSMQLKKTESVFWTFLIIMTVAINEIKSVPMILWIMNICFPGSTTTK